MANQSGTLTSSNGFLTITGSPNDTLTITPTAGSFTLEYPIGTTLATAFSATGSYTLTAGGQARLQCITGSVAYLLTDNPDGYALSQAQVATTQTLVAGAGTQSATTRPWQTSAPQLLGGVGTSVPRHLVVRGFSETSGLTLTNQDANITGTMSIDTASPLGGTALKINIVNTAGASRYVDIQSGANDIFIPNFKGTGRR